MPRSGLSAAHRVLVVAIAGAVALSLTTAVPFGQAWPTVALFIVAGGLLVSSIWLAARRLRGTALLSRADTPLIAVASVLAAWCVAARTAPLPFVNLGTDAANIASFAAMLDHPDAFRGDLMFANAAVIRSYLTIHIPLIRLLARATGDYGAAYVAMLGPHVFLHLVGFYLLGRELFGNRYWAALGSLAAAALVWTSPGDYWGVFGDPQPRFTFAALLPFLFAATLRLRHRPDEWPWLMAAAGALMYVHPPSTPGIGAAIWLGLWLLYPPDWKWRRVIGQQCRCAASFFLVASPFLVIYLLERNYGVVARPAGADAVMHELLGQYLQPWPFFSQFLARMQVAGLPWAGGAAAVVLVFVRRDTALFRVVLAWAVGILLVAVGLPQLEQAWERAHGLHPVQIDLVRGVRYLVPLLLMAFAWVCARSTDWLHGRVAARSVVAVAGTLLIGSYCLAQAPDFLRQSATCFADGRVSCPEPGAGDRRAAIVAVGRLVPAGAPTFLLVLHPEAATSMAAQTVRYLALRPMVANDPEYLYFSDLRAFVAMYRLRQETRAIHALPAADDRVARGLALGQSLRAEYVLVDEAPGTERLGDWRRVWQGERYSLWGRDHDAASGVNPGSRRSVQL